jgi:hypothetical protein
MIGPTSRMRLCADLLSSCQRNPRLCATTGPIILSSRRRGKRVYTRITALIAATRASIVATALAVENDAVSASLPSKREM